MQIYGLKNCDTCRKALKSLDGALLIDIREQPMAPELLERAYQQFAEKLVNTRSTTWRNLPEEERQKTHLDLLSAHPALMKRPLIETDEGEFLLGWTPNTRQSLGILD